VTGSDPGPRTGWSTATDPLLAALAEARARKDQADNDIRLLLAYARELIWPRPYKLTDLAAAAGLSVSGVRTAYTTQHIDTAQHLLRPHGNCHGSAAACARCQPADA
jgi:hypothetical protein